MNRSLILFCLSAFSLASIAGASDYSSDDLSPNDGTFQLPFSKDTIPSSPSPRNLFQKTLEPSSNPKVSKKSPKISKKRPQFATKRPKKSYEDSISPSSNAPQKAPSKLKNNSDEKKSSPKKTKTQSAKKFNRSKKNLIPPTPLIVTIDGGSATKKSPIAKALARKFNLVYLEMGAIYRTLSYVLLQQGLDPFPQNKREIDTFLTTVPWQIAVKQGAICCVINGELISDDELRSEEINTNVALYSSRFESVREFCAKIAQSAVLLKSIKEGKHAGIIAEGRTCGSRLFPNAQLKFCFYATEEAKIAFRKDVEQQIDDPIKRDRLDQSRMTRPEETIPFWTHKRTIKESVQLLSAFITQKIDELIETQKDFTSLSSKADFVTNVVSEH